MKNFTIICFLLMSYITTSGQKYDIKGALIDTLQNPLVAATVMLMDHDSILIDYTQTDLQGNFIFKGVTEKSCLIKTTYLGYFPLTLHVAYSDNNKIDMGNLVMQEIAKELMEIVIKEARAPLRMRGDTVEYDASQFKVPQGSSLEDLLRRLPGIEVSQDGALQSDGKNVSKLTVDGKTFFSEDPKFAIKNLPADGVSKVQVFDKKDEEALLTGKSNASQEKTMNIELKEEFKKGGFGKVTVGGGSEGRGELKGNYNKFDTKNQLSLIGVANNTGRNGLSWDDYQDFMGSNSWDDNGDYDYGFGNEYNRSFGGGGTDLESKVSSAFFTGNDGGFPTNILGGVNYNHDHKKNKFAGRYFYQNMGNDKTTLTDSRSFLTGYYLDDNRTDTQDKTNINHRIETQYQHDIDSFLTTIVTADLAIVNSNTVQNGDVSISKNGQNVTSTSNYDNQSDLKGKLLNTSLLLRKKFRKAGRSIGVNAIYLKTDITEDQKRFSDNTYLNTVSSLDSTQILRQFNDDVLDKNVIKFNALVSEPLNKKLFIKVFYNNKTRNEDGTRTVTDQDQLYNTLIQNDILSRNYSNTIVTHRTGSTLTLSHKGISLTGGLAYLTIDLNGKFQSPDTLLYKGSVDYNFYKWTTFAELNGNLSRNTWFSLDYNTSVSEPNIENLLPIVDYSNPLYIKEGNPDLRPTITQNSGLWISHSWPADAIRISAYASYHYFDDQIIQQLIVDDNLVTKAKPINYSGGNRIWSGFNFTFPIRRNKIKMSTNIWLSFNKSFAYVNNLLNNTKTIQWSPRVGFDITPSKKTAIYLNASFSFSNTQYDINTTQNQEIINQNYEVTFNTNFVKGWFWNSNLRYSIYQNDRFGIAQNIPIINLSIYRQFLKGNKGELRLSLYDALNKNILINQSTSPSRVFDARTPSLAQYFMLSFSYNIKGMSTDVDSKSNFW